MHDFLSSLKNLIKYFEKHFSEFTPCNKGQLLSKLLGYKYSSKYIFFCSAKERKLNRFEKTHEGALMMAEFSYPFKNNHIFLTSPLTVRLFWDDIDVRDN